MLEIDYEHCTGCGACVQRCPKKCISWQFRELGFKYPDIDKEKCINCHQCEKVCPIDKALVSVKNQHVYALVNDDKATLQCSTSGGAFSAIAKMVLNNGGVVYGCSMEKGFQVQHVRVSDSKQLNKLRGSKYVQSDTANSFCMLEQDLKQGITVLYSGTPCQVTGLKSFLGKEYDNLITVDIVCHGVGSQRYFDKFLEDLSRRKGKLQELRFRDKKYVGWSCGGGVVVSLSNNGLEESPFYNFDNYYYSYFLSGDIYRQSCYSCKYANTIRQGDITLGDFWGVEAFRLDLNTYDGCSLVITNSDAGKNIVDNLSGVEKVEVNIEKAIRHNDNLSAPSRLTVNRNKRITEFDTMSGSEIEEIYLKENNIKLIKGKVKTMVPYSVKRWIRSLH